MKSLIKLEDITCIDRFPNEKSEELHVEWFIGKRCNYDCSYCHDLNHDNFSPHVDIKHTINIIDKMIDKFGNRLSLNFTGGEPTVHPDFDKLCDFISNKNISVSMTTNGTRVAQYYIDIYKAFAHITFSQHFEHAKNEVFLPKMKFINENRDKKSMQVQVMYHAQYEAVVREAIDYYEKHSIPYTVRRIRPTKNHKYPTQTALMYSEQQIETIREYQISNPRQNIEVKVDNIKHAIHTNQLNGLAPRENPYLNFKGWLCWAGVSFIRIHENKVYRCWGEIDKPIGDITDPNFTLPNEPLPCIANKCACVPEIATKKIKSQS